MPARPRRDPTDDWEQRRLLVGSPEQEAHKFLRPIYLEGWSAEAIAGYLETSRRRSTTRRAGGSPRGSPAGRTARGRRVTTRAWWT